MFNFLDDGTTDQVDAYSHWKSYLTNLVFDMFRIENCDFDVELTIKYCLLLGGRVVFFKHHGDVVASWFNAGGEIGIYPTFYDAVIANPKIPDPPHLVFKKNSVPVYLNVTDAYREHPTSGYRSLIELTARQLADNAISIENLQFIKRLPTVFTARTDVEKTAMELMLGKIKQGLKSIVARVPLNDSVKRLDGGQGTALLQEFTEYQQYVLGNFYNSIGVNCPWNLKRERVTSTETQQNDESIRYNLYAQVQRLNRQFDEVNAMFGTDYKLTLSVDEIRDDMREEVREDADSAKSELDSDSKESEREMESEKSDNS